MTSLTISTDSSLKALDDRYRALFVEQRQRLVPVLASLTEEQWQAPSRNSEWTVQQTMQHVAGVLIENVRVFDGQPRTWSADFDPHRSPQEDIDTRAGETPEETLDGYVAASERFVEHLASRSSSEQRSPMLWGEPADFRLFFVHLHWDAWVHERDMLLPIGIDAPCQGDPLRFATAYAVLFAGVAIRMGGGSIDTAVAVPGLGVGHLCATPEAVRVDLDADVDAACSAADAGLLVDALAGRAAVSDAVDAEDDVLGALSLIGAFLRG